MIRGAAISAAILAALCFGCQTEPHRAALAPAEGTSPAIGHPVGNEAGQANDTAAGGTATNEAGGAPGDAGGGGAPDDVPLFGANEIVTAAVADCVKATGMSPVAVLPASPTNPVYDRLGSIGGRRFAFSYDAQALLTFDTGGNISTTLNDVAGVASNATQLSVVFQNATQTVLQRYDESLTAQGHNVNLANGGALSLAVAATQSATLVSWIDGDQVLTRVATGDTLAELGIPLGGGLGHCRSRAVSAGTNFALVWSCTGVPNEVHWALVSDTAKLLKTVVVLQPSLALELNGFMATANGYLLMLHGLEQKTAYLVRIDSEGRVDGAIRALAGLPQAFDLTTSSSGVSVTAMLEDGTTALGRILNATAPDAAGTWTCLDQASPGGHAALEAVEQTDSVLVRYGNGSEWLMALPH